MTGHGSQPVGHPPDVAGLPTGTLTMLFTDIEGSTRLLSRLGSRYGGVVSTQRAVVRDAVRRWGGVELGTEGDSFFVVFRSAVAGLSAARDIQRGLASTPWPDGVEVLVRMGLHTGEPTPHEDSYMGMDVHRAARVAAGAHGGQVVLTEATLRLVEDSPPEDVTFVDLGHHRFKDLPQPEHVYEARVAGLEREHPSLKSLGAATSLPVPTTSLVGRRDEIALLTDLLGGEGTRLVTLTGSGGTGKTRLALAAAAAVEAMYPDGVFFVPLAPVRTADVMWTTMAAVLGVAGESKDPPTFLAHLAERRALLVLDNLEQLPHAAEVVARLLAGAPRTHVLATSRRPLHVAGEHEVPIEPLPVAGPGRTTGTARGGISGAEGTATDGTAVDLAEGGAVELFVERARLVRPGFTLTPENAEDVREICRSLDGLPLAIELVAARTKLLSPKALRARLDQALEISRPDVGLPARQQTLRSALDWSFELLPEDLRHSFRAFGVCEGEVDLATAEAVVDAGDVLDQVAGLVDASLLTVREGADGEPRVRMLRTVALYARDQLRGRGELDAARWRHASHFAARAEAANDRLRGPDHLAAKDHLEQDLPNLRAALRWTLVQPPASGAGEDAASERLHLGLRLCEHLGWFWYGCGYQAEGRRWLQQALDVAGTTYSREVVVAVHGLAVLVLQQGDARRARDLLRLCLDYWRRVGDKVHISSQLNSLGIAYRSLGEEETARKSIEEAVALAREAGDPRREANAVSNLALLLLDAGEPDAAIEQLRRALVLDTELQDAWGQAADHVNLSGALLRAGRTQEAYDQLLECAHDAVGLGDVELTVDVLALLCVVHARRGETEVAARLLGTCERLREQAELPLTPPDAAWFESEIAPVRARVDPAVWKQHRDAGARDSVEDALSLATAPV